MKNRNYKNIRFTMLVCLGVFLFTACDRDFSDDVQFATFSQNGEIFVEAPVGLGSDFYFPFLNAKADAFSVDNDEGFESNSSIRIDVPNADDPAGGFAG
ncbi:MAG: glycosyl hydrolase family 16, partial [Bacteroidota bacterium]